MSSSSQICAVPGCNRPVYPGSPACGLTHLAQLKHPNSTVA